MEKNEQDSDKPQPEVPKKKLTVVSVAPLTGGD